MTTAYEIFEKKYISRTKKSKEMYDEARHYLAGEVPGAARYRRPYPLYLKEAKGSRILDVDGNEYVDLLCGTGPAILGHSPVPVMEAVRQQLDHGTIIQIAPEVTVEVAKRITQHMPGMEMLRFVNSGSEGVYLALRVARAYTGREKHAKCEGKYNGQLDNELISGSVFGGSEDCPQSLAQSAGISQSVLNDVIVLPWNKAEASVAIIKN